MVGNKCVMWQLMWNNQSIAITNVMVRFLDIYIYIYIYMPVQFVQMTISLLNTATNFY